MPAGSGNVYFEAVALIVLLILLGRSLEAAARRRTGVAIRRLTALAPKTARVLRGSVEVAVEVGALRVGDHVRLAPGARVPVDGTVVAGGSRIDEGMITGEPAPVAKTVGDTVVGGTVNTTGSLDFVVTGIGADTVLAGIVRMVEAAQGAKLPIQAVVDRVTAWFVPAVMAAAVATFLLWAIFGPSLALAVVNGVAVLIIACPCAMGLATPTSIMVGTGRGAERGILFRHGDALQALGTVRIVALDKTGTLTEGRPAVTAIHPAAGIDEATLLRFAAAVEARSEHPVGAAIRTAAGAGGLVLPPVEAFEALPGFGVSGHVEGRRVDVGAARFMVRLGLDADDVAAADAMAEQAGSPVHVAVDGRLAGVLAAADPIRRSAPGAVAALRSLGLGVAMVTGDNRRTAETVARTLGIDMVVADVLPDGKVAAIRGMAGGPVAFVGDGINDAPALAAAAVGIAIGTGTDIAVESADVVLMSDDLDRIATAIRLSRAVMRNIRQNLGWAFAYNVALIPVAAGVLFAFGGPLLSPVLAAGAMALSSLFVVTNALRLRRFDNALPVSVPDGRHGALMLSRKVTP